MNNNDELMTYLPKSKTGLDKFLFILKIVFTILACLVLVVGAWWYFTVKWGSETWSELTLQELVFTLTMNIEGTNSDMIADHISSCVVPAVIILAVAIAFFIVFRRKKTVYTIGQIAAAVTGAFMAVVGFTYAWEVLDLTYYLESQESYSSFIDENYVDPATVPITFPEEKRNLIYIFLESMETTFADEASGGAFPENVIPELTDISLSNENFSGAGNNVLNGGHSLVGSTWTIGAIFSQTSGLPLTIPIENNSMSLQDDFFSSVTCLGNILEKEGYKQTFVLGSDVAFGGRNLYFQQHGNFELRDYYYYLNNGTIPPDYFVWWGYEDSILIENAKKTLNELAAGDQPFNMTMLTVDTHFEDGYVCDLCGTEFDDQYSNVYACSSKQISAFIDWIKEQPFYENTTIILAGDHKTMDKNYCTDYDDVYDRKTYFTVINSPASPENDVERNYSTFDIFPTTLAALGATIPGNRLGLGTNLYSSEKTLLELYGIKLVNEGLQAKSQLMEELTAGINKDYGGLDVGEYDAETRTVIIKTVDAKVPESSKGLLLFVWPEINDKAQVVYQGEKINDTDYQFVVSLDDFGAMNGTYVMHLYTKGTNRNTFLTSTSMVIDDPNAVDGIKMVAADTAITVGDVDYSTGQFNVSITDVPENVILVDVAVWTKPDQSDIRWYQAVPNEFGTYTVSISAADFGIVGAEYNIHCYGTTIDGENKAIKTMSQIVE